MFSHLIDWKSPYVYLMLISAVAMPLAPIFAIWAGISQALAMQKDRDSGSKLIWGAVAAIVGFCSLRGILHVPPRGEVPFAIAGLCVAMLALFLAMDARRPGRWPAIVGSILMLLGSATRWLFWGTMS